MCMHADTMWTDADCPQNCGQIQTINADSTETCFMQIAINGKYGMVHLQSGEQVRFFEVIKLALLPVYFLARINVVNTVESCGHKMWTDADCPQ